MKRLDIALVERGLAPSRAQARAAIEAGAVTVNGAAASKASIKVGPGDELGFTAAHPWASRAGLKLAHALDVFAIDPAGRLCLDLGASTGGFVDVLLAHGAERVAAVDVGRGQLAERLAADPRVRHLEGTDARGLTLELIGGAPGLITADLSFIALEKAIGPALALAAAGADAVILFKPQFQVGRAHVGKGGVVRDGEAVMRAQAAFEAWLDGQGWRAAGWTESPILGGDGNRELLAHLRRP